MSEGIFLIQADGTLVEMREKAYDSEDLLQRLLSTYPNLLPSDQITNGVQRRWLLVKREAGVPGEEGGGGRWSVDHLFLDQDGVPTLIEVKRSTDTRIRREVVGQMLDYAANAALFWSAESLRAQFEAQCQARGVDPEAELGDCLGIESDAEGFWQQVKTNLQAGRLRLVFVADEVPIELRRVVEYLNRQMSPTEVLAVEIKQYTSGELRTMVPRLIGQTQEARERKAGSVTAATQWNEEKFFDALETRSPTDAAIARKLLDWARPRVTRIWYGYGQQRGSLVPILHHAGARHQLFAVWTSGVIEFYFQYHANKPPFSFNEKRRELLNKLNQLPGVELPADSINKRPYVNLSVLTNDDTFERFCSTYDWFLSEITS